MIQKHEINVSSHSVLTPITETAVAVSKACLSAMKQINFTQKSFACASKFSLCRSPESFPMKTHLVDSRFIIEKLYPPTHRWWLLNLFLLFQFSVGTMNWRLKSLSFRLISILFVVEQDKRIMIELIIEFLIYSDWCSDSWKSCAELLIWMNSRHQTLIAIKLQVNYEKKTCKLWVIMSTTSNCEIT